MLFLCAFIDFSFQDSSDKLVTEPTKLQSLDVAGDTSQESQFSECPVSQTRSKERQLEEARETTVCFGFGFFCAFLIYLNLPFYC